MNSLLIATRNLHKLEEIRAVLGDPWRYLSLRDFPDAPAVVEDAGTFAGNATKKALTLARWLTERLPAVADRVAVLADDSGLEVDALQGAPGVHSARFTAAETGLDGNAPDAENNRKLLRLLQDVPPEKRTARFRCVLALTPVLTPPSRNQSPVCDLETGEALTEIFEGVCDGRIGLAPRGTGGFGYDPLFLPEGRAETFAELGEAIKNQVSHRARALAKLQAWLACDPRRTPGS